jgi:hypothetical protein
MDGLAVKVKTVDGNENTYKLTPRVIVGFEQQFGKGLPKLIGEEQRIEHIYWLEMHAGKWCHCQTFWSRIFGHNYHRRTGC